MGKRGFVFWGASVWGAGLNLGSVWISDAGFGFGDQRASNFRPEAHLPTRSSPSSVPGSPLPCTLLRVDIRFAEESDLPALLTLINRAFEVERSFKLEPRLDAHHTREYFHKGHFLVAQDDAGLAGCVFVELDGERACLGLLSVDPSRQKTGLGRQLTSAAEDFARGKGALRMELTVVNLRTDLPPFYRKLGYLEVGEEPIPVEWASRINRPCHFICMARSLSTETG